MKGPGTSGGRNPHGVRLFLFGTAAPTQWFGYRWLLRREARQFADAFFEFLRQGEPHKAYQLTLHPEYRQPLDEKLWRFYRESPHWRGELKNGVATFRGFYGTYEVAAPSFGPVRFDLLKNGPRKIELRMTAMTAPP